MSLIEVKVPDIGDFKDVPVIEVQVSPGDTVQAEDSLVTLESDKAVLEIPAPAAGTVREIKLKVGDKVSEGTLVLLLESTEAVSGETVSGKAVSGESEKPADAAAAAAAPSEVPAATPATPPASPPPSRTPASPVVVDDDGRAGARAHASPSVRKFARELGVDIQQVGGSGPKQRILREDVQNWVKQALQGGGAAAAGAPGTLGGLPGLAPWPQVDFSKFGPIETKPRSRIQKISGANLARNWAMIPHVTQFDEADITELEALRVQLNRENEKAGSGAKLTLLAFLIKAAVAALQRFPDFNSSLDGDNLVVKRYWHIGFAADTPNGLVVPVIRDADRKGVVEIAEEMAALSARARAGKLGPADMQGGCFSISSLGGIGGTAFTPIINAPEVAILGVSKTQTRPVWDGAQFAPRLLLPLSLSYDHRVIDGAQAARFISHFSRLLADLRRVLL